MEKIPNDGQRNVLLKLKLLRKEKGMTQKRVANYLHMSLSGFKKYECCKCFPPMEKLLKLVVLYETTLDYLMFNGDSDILLITKQDISKAIIGQNLKKIRLENHFTQNEMAEALNICDRTYGLWETGYRYIKFESLKGLVEIYNKKIDCILFGVN